MTFPSDLALANDAELPNLPEHPAQAEADAAANFYLAALKRYDIEQQSADAELAATISLLHGRHQFAKGQRQHRVDALLQLLQRVYQLFPAQGKAKSRKLLAGAIGTRKRGGKWKIVDQDALKTWATAHYPEIITAKPVEYRVLLADLERVLGDRTAVDGLSGAEYQKAEDHFFAEPL